MSIAERTSDIPVRGPSGHTTKVSHLPILSSTRSRSLILQAACVAAVLAVVAGLVMTAHSRITEGGMASGFDFLFRATGWDLGFSVIPLTSLDPYWKAFLAGALNTLLLGVTALSLATLIGVVIGGMRTSRNALTCLVGRTYVDIFRNIPMMLQLLLWYKLLGSLPSARAALNWGDWLFLSNRGIYLAAFNITPLFTLALLLLVAFALVAAFWMLASRRISAGIGERLLRVGLIWLALLAVAMVLFRFGRIPETPLIDLPQARGLNIRGGLRISPELLACIIALAVYGGAYIAEIVRSGFNAIDPGVIEAAKALGLRNFSVLTVIRLPLMLRAALPTLINQYVWLMKATTIGIAVGFADLFMVVSSSINQSGQAFEIIAIFVVAFLTINYSISFILNLVNRAIALKGTQLRSSGRSEAIGKLMPESFAELRRVYFGSLRQIVVTVGLGVLVAWALARLLEWAVFSAVWNADGRDLCLAEGAGACWSVIAARWRLILFGLYPQAEHIRSALATGVLLSMMGLTAWPRMWSLQRIALVWFCGFAAFFVLMGGGVFGLTPVAVRDWGGLTLTLFIFVSVVALGMPLGLGLALLRRSRLGIVSGFVAVLIDVTRSLPLLALIYTAAIVLPFALPHWLQGEKLWRVIAAFALFYACYQAEIFRSGFQSVPLGQEEAAKSLGLGYVDRIGSVLLPQAFRITLPATINQLVITFKETSLVTIIGFFEILASGAAAFGNPEWSFAYLEVYVFVGAIYFFFVTLISRFGTALERRMNVV
jgi:general L-amino acid transport system permease protein